MNYLTGHFIMSFVYNSIQFFYQINVNLIKRSNYILFWYSIHTEASTWANRLQQCQNFIMLYTDLIYFTHTLCRSHLYWSVIRASTKVFGSLYELLALHNYYLAHTILYKIRSFLNGSYKHPIFILVMINHFVLTACF